MSGEVCPQMTAVSAGRSSPMIEHPRTGLTPVEAAEKLGVPRSAIDLWRHRGHIVPMGIIRGRGRPTPLYFIEELEPLAAAYRERVERRATRGASDQSRPSGRES